jgi:hypothetical protein
MEISGGEQIDIEVEPCERLGRLPAGNALISTSCHFARCAILDSFSDLLADVE